MAATLSGVELLWALGIIGISCSQVLVACLVLEQTCRLGQLKEAIVSLADDLNAVRDQLSKAKGEIVAKIGGLETALASAGDPDPAVAAAVEALKSAAQELDDVVPDAASEDAPATDTPTE